MKNIPFVILAILLVAVVAGSFVFKDEFDEYKQELTTIIPKNYKDCVNTQYSNFDNFGCSLTYYGKLVVKKCHDNGGCLVKNSKNDDKSFELNFIDNDTESCYLSFYNPNLSYPSDYQGCVSFVDPKAEASPHVAYDSQNKSCKLSILEQCNGDRDGVKNLLEKCPEGYEKNNNYPGSCKKVFALTNENN